MRHYILVRWKNWPGDTRRTLVNLHKIVTVVDSVQCCKIHFQGYCLDVEDSFEDVCGMIEAAEAEGSRKPGRPLMGTGDWMDRPGASAPVQCRAQWEADRNGWPYCTNCGVPAAIDREEFRMKGNIRADKSPRCPTCGANMYGKDTNVPGIPPDMAETQRFLEQAFRTKIHCETREGPEDSDPKRKPAFRFGEEEPGESSSIAAPAAMRSIPTRSDDGGGVTPYERTAPQAAAHERRRDPPGVPFGEVPEEAAEDPRG